MDIKLVAPDRTIDAVEHNRLTDRVATWAEQVTSRVNNAIVEGEGTPEGSVSAPRLTLYFDNINDQLYIKKSQLGSATGWVLL